MGTPELPEANREYEIVIQNKNIPMQELRKKIVIIVRINVIFTTRFNHIF